MIETIIIHLAALLAAAYLVRFVLGKRLGKACGGCTGCPSSTVSSKRSKPQPIRLTVSAPPRVIDRS